MWALMDYGFRVVMSASLRRHLSWATAAKSGLLAAKCAQEDIELLWKILERTARAPS